MARFTLETVVHAPVEEVFRLFSDVEHAPGRIKAIRKVEMLTPGPVRAGTRFKETRVVFKREATEEMEFLTFEPSRSYSLGCASCGARYLTTFVFEPIPAGTRVLTDFTWKAVTFFAKLTAPLGWLMKGMIKKCLQGDLEEMKAFAESREPTAAKT